MKKEDWQKIEKIVDEALQLKSENRKAFIKKKCKNSPKLLSEVESLLANEGIVDDFFDSTAVSKYANLIEEEIPTKSEALINKKIENYKILKELGSGGMGAVFLAERTFENYTQKVALKLIRNSFIDSHLENRFLREQQILASLNHPHIAKLIDGGFTENGEPYLAMEYIEGRPLLEFAKEKSLAIRERLELFLKICSAVSYAHQNLVIHRDIKPSNIIVTDDGEPILLDFGVGKILEDEFDSKKTQTNVVALTPAYASPEQLKNISVTTSSDIYSLGVVLYELLTNNLPFETKAKTLSEIIETISKNPPQKPSENYDQSSSLLKAKYLKGDLETIILKSLRKEPARRYSSVEQFAEDIRRYLQELPINARPTTFSYKTKKFYQRNRIPVLAGLLTFVGLISGTTVAIWQAYEARNQAVIANQAKTKAEAETRKAKQEEEKAKKVNEFMKKIISYANPIGDNTGVKYKGQAKVIDALNEMSDKIDIEFSNQPDIQSELHHKFAEIYNIHRGYETNSKKYDEFNSKTKFHAQSAIRLRKKYYGEKHELVAKDMFYLWVSSLDKNETPEQAKLLANAINMMRETNPKNLNLPHMLTAYANRLWSPTVDYVKKTQEIYYQNAISKPKAERLQLAENYYQEAVKIFEEILPKNHGSIVLSKCYLAQLQIDRKKFKEAQVLFPKCSERIKYIPKNKTETERNKKYKKLLEEGLKK